jgi:hypothetical protein
MGKVVSTYNAVLHSYPLTTKIATGFTIIGIGDLNAQFGIEKRETLDRKRFGMTAIYGILFYGIGMHYWFRFLDVLVGPQQTIRHTCKKLFFDQFVLAPAEIVWFLGWTHYFDGKTVDDWKEKLRTDYWRILTTNYVVWLPSQFCNFAFAPERHRALINSLIGVAWTTYVCWASHNVVTDHSK